MADENARVIPLGSCSWCGHPPHDDTCRATIKTADSDATPCPCTRHVWAANRFSEVP